MTRNDIFCLMKKQLTIPLLFFFNCTFLCAQNWIKTNGPCNDEILKMSLENGSIMVTPGMQKFLNSRNWKFVIGFSQFINLFITFFPPPCQELMQHGEYIHQIMILPSNQQ
jgi:hypothetical protein